MGNADPERSSSIRSADNITLDTIPLHSTNLLTVLDEDGVIQYESPSIERIYGYEQDELLGEQVAEYFHPDDREEVVNAFQTVVSSKTHRVEAVEYRHEQADGTYCWVESVASTNPTPEGHYVINTCDISDRKAREQELVHKTERLDEFASVLSHDLRNPLQVAQGQLRLATEDCDSEHLTTIEQAHSRMGALIDDLLLLAQDGQVIGEQEPVELHSIVTDAWRTIGTDDATLVIETEQVIEADRSRLQQVLENLFRNTVEYGHPGVTIEVGSLPDGFYVEDDGPGIPEQDRSRIFDEGYSGEGGTGLGLSIVERVIQAHGWEITVTDGVAGGARFEIRNVSHSV